MQHSLIHVKRTGSFSSEGMNGERERDRETEKETDRQTESATKTDRRTNRETETETYCIIFLLPNIDYAVTNRRSSKTISLDFIKQSDFCVATNN